MEDGEEEEDEDGVAKSQKVQKKSVSAIAYDEMKVCRHDSLITNNYSRWNSSTSVAFS